MNSSKYCFTSALVFAFVGLLQAWRFVLDLQLRVGAWDVPRILSGIAAIGAGALAVWGFRNASSGIARTGATR